MRRSLALLLLASVVAAFAVACGGGSKKTVSIPGGGEISTSNKVPSSFPSDFPIYDGAKVQGSLTGTNNGITGVTVTWQSDDSVSKVSDFYDSKLKDGNWVASSNGSAGDTSYWIGQNKDGSKSMYAGVSKVDNKTTIIVSIGDGGDKSSSSSDGGDQTSTSSSGSSKTSTSSSSSSDEAEKSPTASPLPPEAKLPSGFPTDRVPLPSGSRVTSASSFSNGGSKTWSIEVYIKDTPENAAKYFETELPKHGWASGFSSESNGEFIATYTSADATATSDSVTVSATTSDTTGYSLVTLLISIAAS